MLVQLVSVGLLSFVFGVKIKIDFLLKGQSKTRNLLGEQGSKNRLNLPTDSSNKMPMIGGKRSKIVKTLPTSQINVLKLFQGNHCIL